MGIDVGNHIQPTLLKAFGNRMGGADTAMMEEMVRRRACASRLGVDMISKLFCRASLARVRAARSRTA